MDGTKRPSIEPAKGDALVIVDVQYDFLPGGALAVPKVIKSSQCLTSIFGIFEQRRLPIYMTRDWHPSNHCSFQEVWRTLADALRRRKSRRGLFGGAQIRRFRPQLFPRPPLRSGSAIRTLARPILRPTFAPGGSRGSLSAGLRRTIASSTPSRMRSPSASQPSFFAMPFVE